MVASNLRSAVASVLGLLAVIGHATPDADKPVADLSFVLTAEQAIFSSNGLILNMTSPIVQYIGTDNRIGILETATFANTSKHSMFLSANGTWLDMPSAIIMAMNGNDTIAALVSPAAPSYDPTSRTLVFGKAMLLPANTSFLTVSKGVTVKMAQQAADGLATPLVDVIPLGAIWTGGVTMFFDHPQGSLVPSAKTEGLLLDLAAAAVVGAAIKSTTGSHASSQQREEQKREDQQRNTYNQNMAASNDAGWRSTFPAESSYHYGGWTATGSSGK